MKVQRTHGVDVVSNDGNVIAYMWPSRIDERPAYRVESASNVQVGFAYYSKTSREWVVISRDGGASQACSKIEAASRLCSMVGDEKEMTC